jgi:hypothetical protein
MRYDGGFRWGMGSATLDRTQPGCSERDQFLRICLAGSPAVTHPSSHRRRCAFSLSVELDGRDGGLRRTCYRDLRTAVAEPAAAKEMI